MMDGIVGKVGGRFRISLTESTMMKILHSAMDKSHERVKSEEGVILRLTEISKFYELAVMLLDGCLRFVHDEAMEESSEEENVVGELAEIRDRLRGRLRETELAIAEKDIEFRRRFGDDPQSPDLKRFDSLGVDFRLEKLKGDGNSDEEFSELQQSVDQQVMNIKQKLGPEYKMVEKRRNKSLDCLKIDQMSSDIDILKGTMDLAFGKMHSAISLAESENRGEQQWGWEVERRTMAVLMRGIVEDLQERYLNEVVERLEVEGLCKEICLAVFEESLRDIAETVDSLKCAEDLESSQCLVDSIKEDIWMVFFREMFKRWQDEMDDVSYEIFLKEDIFKVVVSEVIREANEIFEAEPRKLMISGNLLTDMKVTCSSVSSNVKQAMSQLAESKRHLNDIRGGLGIEDGDMMATYKDHTVPAAMDLLPGSAFEPIIALSKVFMDFQCAVEHRLRSNNLRLQEASRLLTPTAEVFASLKRKDIQYAEAFNRCGENLRKAEIEVDLLGDQVDALLGLLEKIYQIMYHYAPVLQQHFEVWDILLMMKRELTDQKGSLV
ncbi:WPP domain-associated protein (Fragment) [Linum grandiflorum]